MTEPCDDVQSNLISDAATTLALRMDYEVTVAIHDRLIQRSSPQEYFVDTTHVIVKHTHDDEP